MAYYTALIAKWATLTPGTTAAKLAQINAITVTGSVPATFFIDGTSVLNCINWTEFAALTSAQQTMILSVCAAPGQLLGGAGTFLGSMFVATFTNLSGPTIVALTALAKAQVQPWWQATVAQGGGGLSSPVSVGDLTAAGGLT
jgi:uncharacterized protein (DUF2235 family)